MFPFKWSKSNNATMWKVTCRKRKKLRLFFAYFQDFDLTLNIFCFLTLLQHGGLLSTHDKEGLSVLDLTMKDRPSHVVFKNTGKKMMTRRPIYSRLSPYCSGPIHTRCPLLHVVPLYLSIYTCPIPLGYLSQLHLLPRCMKKGKTCECPATLVV